ncbi:Ypt/Rab-GAP domain of gyp1p superfamily protein isoform 3 [Hibiscus syriacus]|uniref:Ypt/Rab-GAP domain of gyp1p superfamily protein isoform 3 n=1 Tax=Hibiscus syriacus TaxID=106335 RepID=A0A6A3B0W3_HIBSY|nr:Ypt/Rab-GAP domain of gyp1p superfamily protein isoform 3 [Hibiscus syriacus]
MAVSMILYLRSSLLATETATSCLQRLLKFPESINLKKLIEKAKSLQILALESNKAPLLSAFGGVYKCSKSPMISHNVPSGLGSPKTIRSLLPDSYWEEKWRVLHKAEEPRQNSLGNNTPSGKKRWAERIKFRLSRTESAPSPARNERCKKEHHSVRRSLLEDLTKQLSLEDSAEKGDCFEASNLEDHHSVEVQGEGQNSANKGSISTTEDRCENGSGAVAAKPLLHDSKHSTADSSVAGASCNSHPTSKGDTMDQNMMGTLKNLGQAMLDHIQVLESVFQQNQGQVGSLDNLSKNILVGKGQVTAITALKELRKMSNLLSEM